ncbi:MAG: DUF4080 domain-containing protein [Christensenellales bacterium]
MKNVTLCGINARYSHSSLALLCLKHAAPTKKITIVEFSINDRIAQIVECIIRTKPDAVGFSCYIWNIEYVLKVASTVKKILPQCLIILGGPEVSYDSRDIMKKYDFIDITIQGEGEIPFAYFIERFEANKSIGDMPSACIRKGCKIISNAAAPPFDLSRMPFMYADLDVYKNKVIYYETSRGCPFRCAYCMSANETMSFLPLERVKAELDYFMRANVRQVKLVDRTFNFPSGRFFELIRTLIDLSEKYPQSSTNFHLEISASLLEDRAIALLKEARKNLIQLEIGIQSTNPETLRAVSRSHDMQKLLLNTQMLCSMDNIHTHIDLIAGLPYESYDTFKKSFNDAYMLNPDTLQLGFLKMLKGSNIRKIAHQYDIVYSEYPPYEVLSTHLISYEELSMLHRIEHVLNMLYNHQYCRKTLALLIPAFYAPFDFFEAFTLYADKKGYFEQPQKARAVFDLLYEFALHAQAIDGECLKEALSFDWLCLEKSESWLQRIGASYADNDKIIIRRFYRNKKAIQKYLPAYMHLLPKETEKRCLIYVFKYLFNTHTPVLFDFGKKRDDPDFVQKIDAQYWIGDNNTTVNNKRLK